MIRISRAFAYVLLVLLGVAVATAGVFVHDLTIRLGGISLPLGTVVALAGCAGLFVIGGLAMRERNGALLPVVAWGLTTLIFGQRRPRGTSSWPVMSRRTDICSRA